MVDATGSTHWRRLREFAGVDLTQSYALSWHVEADMLIIDVDLYLEPNHPFYEKPRPAEKVCIRPASIEFPYCDDISVDGGETCEATDIVDKIRHGVINDLWVTEDGRYAISGEFGTVSVNAERPILRLKGS